MQLLKTAQQQPQRRLLLQKVVIQVSNYDDPGWYEQLEPPERHNKNQPPPKQPAYENFGPPQPFLVPGSYPPAQMAVRQPRNGNRMRRTFGQSVLLIALLLIAFLGGWFSNQALSNRFTAS